MAQNGPGVENVTVGPGWITNAGQGLLRCGQKGIGGDAADEANFLLSFGSHGRGDGQFDCPFCIPMPLDDEDRSLRSIAE